MNIKDCNQQILMIIMMTNKTIIADDEPMTKIEDAEFFSLNESILKCIMSMH